MSKFHQIFSLPLEIANTEANEKNQITFDDHFRILHIRHEWKSEIVVVISVWFGKRVALLTISVAQLSTKIGKSSNNSPNKHLQSCIKRTMNFMCTVSGDDFGQMLTIANVERRSFCCLSIIINNSIWMKSSPLNANTKMVEMHFAWFICARNVDQQKRIFKCWQAKHLCELLQLLLVKMQRFFTIMLKPRTRWWNFLCFCSFSFCVKCESCARTSNLKFLIVLIEIFANDSKLTAKINAIQTNL